MAFNGETEGNANKTAPKSMSVPQNIPPASGFQSVPLGNGDYMHGVPQGVRRTAQRQSLNMKSASTNESCDLMHIWLHHKASEKKKVPGPGEYPWTEQRGQQLNQLQGSRYLHELQLAFDQSAHDHVTAGQKAEAVMMQNAKIPEFAIDNEDYEVPTI
ncbi:hypothetical protein FSST1_002466 [Fusarium sambucinum]